jgi:hypothetical protein
MIGDVMKRITVTVDDENWKRYRQLKAELLVNYPEKADLTFTELVNIALKHFNPTTQALSNLRHGEKRRR